MPYTEDSKMIKLICGEKGSGKTKIILDSVNETAKTALGNVVFISQKKGYSANIDFKVRCVYTEDYALNGLNGLIGFIDGLMAGNADIEYVYLDGIMRIADCDANSLEPFFAEADKLSKEYGVKFVLTLSVAKDNMPEFVSKYC